MAFGGSIKLTGADEYKKALSQISQNLKVVSSEMKSTASSFEAGDKSQKELNASAKELRESLEQQKKRGIFFFVSLEITYADQVP